MMSIAHPNKTHVIQNMNLSKIRIQTFYLIWCYIYVVYPLVYAFEPASKIMAQNLANYVSETFIHVIARTTKSSTCMIIRTQEERRK